ncbi:LEM3 (ligand-effect modulator 3) family protein [Trifolium pratense]|uniref:LEM3 (Ligand-effect modulator 3) family protein n=1 Tax=Trifolium pratense TaxID=57577 RepID=A0A2K3NRI6_TRIPR|nr:LEM3 (ligand-effect modulator 3) family protein [Trifolium pratense]
MDLDGGSSSTISTGARAIPGRPVRHGALYQFTQQNLPACKPVLTPAAVISTFLLMGFIFIPVGLVTLRASLLKLWTDMTLNVYLKNIEVTR